MTVELNHQIRVVKDATKRLAYRMECSCGFVPHTQNPDDELAAHLALGSVVQDPPPVRQDLRDALYAAAHAWAVTDRQADDRAAEIHRIESMLMTSDVVTAELRAHRDAASISLRAACQAEGAAELKVRELARQILNDVERTS